MPPHRNTVKLRGVPKAQATAAGAERPGRHRGYAAPGTVTTPADATMGDPQPDPNGFRLRVAVQRLDGSGLPPGSLRYSLRRGPNAPGTKCS